MPVPIGLRVSVEFEARKGAGWEDICVLLQVPRELREQVKRIVLEMGREHQRESARDRDAGAPAEPSRTVPAGR